MSRRRKKDKLTVGAEQFALDLLYEASGGKVGRERPLPEGVEPKQQNVSFSDRRALLDSVVKLIAKRHEMNPEDEPEDGIATYRELLNGEPSGESGNRGIAGGAATLSDASVPVTDEE